MPTGIYRRRWERGFPREIGLSACNARLNSIRIRERRDTQLGRRRSRAYFSREIIEMSRDTIRALFPVLIGSVLFNSQKYPVYTPCDISTFFFFFRTARLKVYKGNILQKKKKKSEKDLQTNHKILFIGDSRSAYLNARQQNSRGYSVS